MVVKVNRIKVKFVRVPGTDLFSVIFYESIFYPYVFVRKVSGIYKFEIHESINRDDRCCVCFGSNLDQCLVDTFRLCRRIAEIG